MAFILFDSRQDDIWIDSVSGGGFISYDGFEVTLQVGGSSGDKIVHETVNHFEWQPEQEQRIVMSGNIGAGRNNVKQSMGLGDSFNGLFFECINGEMGIVLRAIDINERIKQADWNIDTVSDIDWDKELSFLIDLTIDKVKFGLLLNDEPKYLHQFNDIDIGFDSLPIRYELKNIGTTRQDVTLTCSYAVITLSENKLVLSENKSVKDRIRTSFNSMVNKLKSLVKRNEL